MSDAKIRIYGGNVK